MSRLDEQNVKTNNMEETRSEQVFTLRLAPGDVEVLKKALAEERNAILKQLNTLHHFGSSRAAIELCRSRSEVETLLDQIESARSQPVLVAPQRREPTVTAWPMRAA